MKKIDFVTFGISIVFFIAAITTGIVLFFNTDYDWLHRFFYVMAIAYTLIVTILIFREKRLEKRGA